MPTVQAHSRQVYDVSSETIFLLQVAAQNGPAQTVLEESLTLAGAAETEALEAHTVGPEGNRLHRFVCPPGRIEIDYRVTAENTIAVTEQPQPSPTLASLPAETLRYTVPSRYCESDKLGDWAGETFGQMVPDDSRVVAIGNWIYEQLTYTPGATGPSSSAVDVLEGRAGVCRDYAHLMIAACRALDVPARYVSGYVANLEPPDFHALVEAYDGDGWYLFDPTRLAPREGLIRIARGLDAAETAFCTIVGEATLVEQSVLAWRADGGPTNESEPTRLRVG